MPKNLNPTLNIQLSKLNELTHLYKLERMCHEFPWTLGILKDCLSIGYLCHSFYSPCSNNVNKEQLIGFMINQVFLDECHLLNICVHPKHQGQGYAKVAINWLLECLHAQNIKSIFLEVGVSNEKALRLYQNLGFKEVGLRQDYYPAKNGREDAIVMKKLL